METPVHWSPLSRFIHWAIALPVLLNFFIDGGDDAHKIFGHIALFALIARVLWGLIAKDRAHFKYFRSRDLLPSIVYVLIWSFVGLLGISGLMLGLDAFWGEEWLEELHVFFSNALMGLVVIHFIGLTLDGIKNKRKTWPGMITGKRS